MAGGDAHFCYPRSFSELHQPGKVFCFPKVADWTVRYSLSSRDGMVLGPFYCILLWLTWIAHGVNEKNKQLFCYSAIRTHTTPTAFY